MQWKFGRYYRAGYLIRFKKRPIIRYVLGDFDHKKLRQRTTPTKSSANAEFHLKTEWVRSFENTTCPKRHTITFPMPTQRVDTKKSLPRSEKKIEHDSLDSSRLQVERLHDVLAQSPPDPLKFTNFASLLGLGLSPSSLLSLSSFPPFSFFVGSGESRSPPARRGGGR